MSDYKPSNIDFTSLINEVIERNSETFLSDTPWNKNFKSIGMSNTHLPQYDHLDTVSSFNTISSISQDNDIEIFGMVGYQNIGNGNLGYIFDNLGYIFMESHMFLIPITNSENCKFSIYTPKVDATRNTSPKNPNPWSGWYDINECIEVESTDIKSAILLKANTIWNISKTPEFKISRFLILILDKNSGQNLF
jgi:hypothetical protein